jgi:putative PIN family toxin of toxin-antitoxin system
VRLVLDTNVVVSALLWSGRPYRLIEAAAGGDVDLVTSPALLAELREVLGREPLASRLTQQRSTVEQAIALYADLTIRVSPIAVARVVPGDIDDDEVIAAAVAGGAALIVTGDRHLLSLASHGDIAIVNVAEALRRLSSG